MTAVPLKETKHERHETELRSHMRRVVEETQWIFEILTHVDATRFDKLSERLKCSTTLATRNRDDYSRRLADWMTDEMGLRGEVKVRRAVLSAVRNVLSDQVDELRRTISSHEAAIARIDQQLIEV